MRTETTTRVLYAFDELSEDAKEKAREWWRGILAEDGPDWAEFAIEDADTTAGILGIDISRRGPRVYPRPVPDLRQPAIYWSLGYSQGDGAGFDARYSYAKGSCKAIREHAPKDAELHRIADALRDAQRRNFYKLYANVESYRDTGIRVAVDSDGPVKLTDDDEQAVKDAIRDFAQWIYYRLRAEDEYRNADEQVDNDIRANEYEFTEDGRRA